MLYQTSEESWKLSFRSKISSKSDNKEKNHRTNPKFDQTIKRHNLKLVNDTRCRNGLNEM